MKYILIFTIGLTAGSYLFLALNPNKLEKLSTPIIDASKKEIIDEILIVTGIPQEKFSNRSLPILKKSFQESNALDQDILGNESFWINLKENEKDQFEEIDEDFLQLSYNFYEKYSRSELLLFLNSRKDEVQIKVLKALNAAMSQSKSNTEKASATIKNNILNKHLSNSSETEKSQTPPNTEPNETKNP